MNWKGTDEFGVFFASGLFGQFTVDSNANAYQDSEDQNYLYGDAVDTPVIGDGNGDGRDEIGVFTDHSGFGRFVLDSNGNGVRDQDDAVYDYGNAADTPIAGD